MLDIFDNSFELEKTKEYSLSIQVSLNGFSFSVIHSSEKRLLALCNNPLKISTEVFLARRFKEWTESSNLLQKVFKEVNVVFDTEKFTIIPEKYYDYDSKEKILNFLFEINNKSVVEENMLEELNARLLFPFPVSLKEEIASHFNEFNLVHPVKIVFENLPVYNKKFRLILLFSDKFFYALLFEETKLLLANSFRFSHENDAVFYVLSMLKQMKISTAAVDLFVSGKVDPDSALLTELQKHFAAIQFLKHKQSIQIDENVFGQPNNIYFSLLT